MILERAEHLVAELRVEDVGGGEIDRDVDLESLASPRFHLAYCRFDDPAREPPRIAGLLGEWHELARRDHAEMRMRPARERFDALHGARVHIHLGLIDQLQAVVLECDAQLGQQRQAATVFLIASGDVQRHASAAGVRIMQGELRATEQLSRRIRVIRERRDAGDRIHVEAHLGDMEARADRSSELLGE